LDYGGFVVGEDMSEAKLLGKSKVCYDHALMSIPGESGKRAWSQKYLGIGIPVVTCVSNLMGQGSIRKNLD
jgi:hypothetical protein